MAGIITRFVSPLTTATLAAVIAAIVLAVSIALTPETLPRLPVCHFHTLTGYPCPGCGLTRAVCCISHGRIGEAWHYNPFGFVFYGLILGCVAWPFLARRFPALTERTLKLRTMCCFFIVLTVAMYAFGIARIWQMAH